MTAGGAGGGPRLLSSRATFAYKVGAPALTVAALAYPFTPSLGREVPEPLRPHVWLGFALVIAFVAITNGWLVTIKQVRLDGEDLLVSNFRDEVRAPLREGCASRPRAS